MIEMMGIGDEEDGLIPIDKPKTIKGVRQNKVVKREIRNSEQNKTELGASKSKKKS